MSTKAGDHQAQSSNHGQTSYKGLDARVSVQDFYLKVLEFRATTVEMHEEDMAIHRGVIQFHKIVIE